MTDLRKILDEATPGPWRIVPDQEGEPAQCITADGFDLATAWGGYLRAEADARLIALAPQLAAALIKAEQALGEATDELDAYYGIEYSGDHPYSQRKLAQAKAANPARAALSEISALTGGRHD